MEKYRNEDYIKRQIMEEGRHYFIFGYKGEQRTNFLKSLEKEYPIKSNTDSPMGIYLEDYGLPKIKISNKELDSSRQSIIADSYFSLSATSKMLKQMILQDKDDQLEKRMKHLLDFINRCCKLKKVPNANNTKELIQLLEESKNMFKDFYYEHRDEGNVYQIFDNIPIPFLDLEHIVGEIKKALENESHMGIIIDHNKEISTPSIRTINQYVGSRINKDISMKVATDPEDWKTYLTQNNQYIEAVHDYGTIELDDSYKKIIRR